MKYSSILINYLHKLLRLLFFLIFVRLMVLLVIGLRISHKERLPRKGPAIIIANHNSHLDTLALMTIFPMYLLHKLRPVAAEDYWFRTPFLKWFSVHIVGSISLNRNPNSSKQDPLQDCSKALIQGDILIIYPEGSRGDPENLSPFHPGIAHLAKRHPDVPIYPIFIHGLGKVLPKGEALLVPFFCDIFVGEPIYWVGSKQTFMNTLNEKIQELAAEGTFPPWE